MEFVFAYLDAASGSMLVQAVIAALVAGPVLFRNKISAGARVLRSAFRRGSPETRTSDTPGS
ncbi:MAG: hypothetical protein M3452_05960 [Chloroflexota bacterium]|nr:hypothetical protein [Chloroflexota bacterium]